MVTTYYPCVYLIISILNSKFVYPKFSCSATIFCGCRADRYIQIKNPAVFSDKKNVEGLIRSHDFQVTHVRRNSLA